MCLAFIFAVGFSAAATLPRGGTSGILDGVLVDKGSREPLVGANVVVVGTTYGAATDAEGYFRIANIRAGAYDVRFSIIGYRTLTMKKVTVLPDVRTRLDVEMEQASVEMGEIEVLAERPLIQRDLAGTAFSLGEMKLKNLPVSTFSEVVLLQPGTTMEGNIRGGKSSEVIYLVDGLPVQDVIGGGLGTTLPWSSIAGVTIHTGGFDATYGNALSGVVNVITKSGGDVPFYAVRYERDNWLPTRWNKQQDRQSELELSAGGRLFGEKLSFFTAHDLLTTDTRWWQDFDRIFPSPVSIQYSGFGKVEYVASPTMRVTAQGIYSVHDWHDYEFSWRFNLNGLPRRGRSSYRVAGVFAHTLSENAFYTVSANLYHLRSTIGEGPKEDLSPQPYEYDFFLRYVTSGKRNWWAETQQMIYSSHGDMTIQFFKHIIRFGFEVNQFDIFSDLVKYEPQLTYFGKPIANAPLLNYSNRYNYQPRSGGVYFQDKIEMAREGSSFSFGLRWDFLDPTAERPLVEFVPVSPNEYQQVITGKVKALFKQQFSPRVSFAAPLASSTFLFANFGRYFQFPLFEQLYSGVNPSQLKGGTRSVLTGNPDLEPERTTSMEIGLRHAVEKNLLVSVTYFKKSFKNQIDSKTLVPFDSKAAGDYGFAQYVNNAEANASGVEAVVRREEDGWLAGSVSYTYMRTEGVSEYVDQRINIAQWGFALARMPFPLSWDQRHTAKADGDFRLPGEIQANLIVLYNSPRPYTYYPTADGYQAVDTTKLLVPNNRRMKDVFIINAKISKQVELTVDQHRYLIIFFADIRNLLNRRNVRWMDSNGRVGGELRDPGAYYDPRRIRAGLRLEF